VAALEPLARPQDAADTRSGGQRRADALAELARRSLEAGRLPLAGGVRPQLTVTVDLDSLFGRPGAVAVGGEVGWAGVVVPEACRRLACDGALTRVLVSRHRSDHNHSSRDAPQPMPDPNGDQLSAALHHPSGDAQPVAHEPREVTGLAGRLRAAMALLPPVLGGAPTQPLEVGRTSRVVQPAQRIALAVRDRLWVPWL
jgi:hypothetical protein